MQRRSSATVFALAVAVAFGLGFLVSGQSPPPPAQEVVVPAKGKCIGIQTMVPTIGSPTVIRAFEDGTVEYSVQHPSNNFSKWITIGK